MNIVINLWEERPLFLILFLAIFFRAIAVIFAGGYGYHDDHFLVIRPAQGWVEGLQLDNLIVNNPDANTSGRSLLYPFIIYLFFSFFELIGLDDPLDKMGFLRLIHAAYSLFTIVIGYRIATVLGTKEDAKKIALILAVFWMFPQIAVRNLVEAVPIPLMLLASLFIIKDIQARKNTINIWYAGILLGICFSLRYQTLFFTGGIGLGLLILKKWKASVYLSISVIVVISVLHGIGDYWACGAPFCKVLYYINYNIGNATSYFSEPWYYYLLLLALVFFPPVGLFLMTGFFRAWKVDVILWLGTISFFVFHSLFPNKQERFIFTIMPLIVILGYLGWQQLINNSNFWKKNKGVLKWSWIVFWVLNTPMVFLYSAYYNKKARIEGMVYLKQKSDLKNFVMIDKSRPGIKDAPLFYLEKEVPYLRVTNKETDQFVWEKLQEYPDSLYPNYLIILQKQGEFLDKKENDAKAFFPDISYLTTTKMGIVDMIRNKVNKNLKLDDWAIYKINKPSNIQTKGAQ